MTTKKDFSIIEFFKGRPLSWSAISSFEYNPEQWYKRYYLGFEEPKTAELEFGSKVGKMLEKNPEYLPMITRQSKMEHPFKVVYNSKLGKIPMVGYADSFCTKTYRKLEEFKTGKKLWDQKRANEHGQITMYCMMNYITKKIKPEDMEICIHWMPTRENGDFTISFIEPIEKNIKHFVTKRTMQDIIQFGIRIDQTVMAMQEYVNNHE